MSNSNPWYIFALNFATENISQGYVYASLPSSDSKTEVIITHWHDPHFVEWLCSAYWCERIK